MEARSAFAPVFPVKSRKGKIEFTRKPAIGAPGARPKDPPMPRRQRRVFGTLCSSNFPAEVLAHKTPLRPKTVPLARKMEKENVEFPEKTLRNLRKDNTVVQQSPVTSSPRDIAMAWVANPKPKLTSRPLSLTAETSSRKTGHIDPKLEKSVCFPEKSRSNPKEDNIVVLKTPVASSPGSIVKHRVSDLNPKPEKSVCLPMNSREDDMALLTTPVTSYATDASPSMVPSVAEKPSSDEKTSDLGMMPKKKKKSVCFQEKSPRLPMMDDTLAPRTPVAPLGGAVKPRRSGTPYHTAKSCRTRRLDRLETASYWLTQIKVAESATKHFVSAAFFRLSFESKAEPVRNLRVELRRYLAWHAHLSEHPEWKDVSQRYGLVKDVGGGEGADCSVTRDIGLIKLSGEIHIRQGDSREDIGKETREHLADPDVHGADSLTPDCDISFMKNVSFFPCL